MKLSTIDSENPVQPPSNHPEEGNTLFDALRKTKGRGTEIQQLRMERDSYLMSLNDLYLNFKGWLSAGEKENLLFIRNTEVQIDEELLGAPYTAPGLQITFPTANRIVDVEPAGTFMIGAWGRVDLKTGIREFILLRMRNDDGSIGWRFKEPPRFGAGPASFPVLNEDLFLDLIKKLIF